MTRSIRPIGSRPVVTAMNPSVQVGAGDVELGDIRKSEQRTDPFGGLSGYTSLPEMTGSNNKREMEIVGAERVSNYLYRQNKYNWHWYSYAAMDWYFANVSILSTIRTRFVSELFRYNLEWRPKFAYKCNNCDYESEYVISECPVCKGRSLRKPNPVQQKYFVRPNGKSFIEEANDNGQSLLDVLRMYAQFQVMYNEGYINTVAGDIVDKRTKELIRSYPLEFIADDPKFMRCLYDETGKPGTTYCFSRDDRGFLINYDDEDTYSENGRELAIKMMKAGKTLYPAYWQLGSNLGGSGECMLYTSEEVYHDHWYTESFLYGVPIGLDIEDNLLTYLAMEKHNFKKYKFGYVRKILILPGFPKEDAIAISKDIQNVLARNDNSIPILCVPPALPQSPEMDAKTLELGTESSSDLMMIKNDIRDRICAHWSIPNIFVGDVEASGGMNNESQQITIFDRYLLDKYNRVDRILKWVLSWFPKITDWELVLMRPSKAYTDERRRLDRMQEASQMKQLGFVTERIGGEWFFSEQPVGQEAEYIQDQQQLDQLKSSLGSQRGGAADPNRGQLPGDGEGPPEKGSARRADSDIDEAKQETEESQREAGDAADI